MLPQLAACQSNKCFRRPAAPSSHPVRSVALFVHCLCPPRRPRSSERTIVQAPAFETLRPACNAILEARPRLFSVWGPQSAQHSTIWPLFFERRPPAHAAPYPSPSPSSLPSSPPPTLSSPHARPNCSDPDASSSSLALRCQSVSGVSGLCTFLKSDCTTFLTSPLQLEQRPIFSSRHDRPQGTLSPPTIAPRTRPIARALTLAARCRNPPQLAQPASTGTRRAWLARCPSLARTRTRCL